MYSGRAISIQDLLKNPYLFEIDHIIPKSISFDDSRTNKVLVYRTENQEKRNQTPYLYLKNLRRSWGYDEYRSYVLELKRKGLIPKAKLDKLLFTEDITKIEVLKGFLSRNLNDTRYASRMVLNILQSYFKAKKQIPQFALSVEVLPISSGMLCVWRRTGKNPMHIMQLMRC